MPRFVDVTGKKDTPECPKDKGIALMLEVRTATLKGTALWRCPKCNKVYSEEGFV